MKYLMPLLLISGCAEPMRYTPTPIQKSYLESLPLEARVFMESCTNVSYDRFEKCITDLKNLGTSRVAKTSPERGIINTAVGTAVGYGAAKLLIGK